MSGHHSILFAVALCLCEDRATAETWGEFEKPVRLQVDGEHIDVGDAWGHAGPSVADVDGDGLRDLVVGDFSGRFRLFRNRHSNQQPEYAPQELIMAGGEEAKVPIYCCIGSSPLFVDYDGDAHLDLLSGSYDPGECYLFRGTGANQFAARETVVDEEKLPVLKKPDQRQNYESFGSWPAVVDWDEDGDLDLLVGTFEGTIFLRINEGSRKAPELATKNIFVKLGEEDLKLPKGHSAVAVADWDGDGLWDLLLGCEDGAVYWFKNNGKPGAPNFTEQQTLVPAHEGNGYDEILEADAEPVPGIRSQIAVCDYNDDGKLDLLLGDFCTNITPKPDLSSEDLDRFNTVSKDLEESGKFIGEQMEKMRSDFQAKYPGEEVFSEEAGKAWGKAYQEWKDSDPYKGAESKRKELEAEQGMYLLKPPKPGTFNEYSTTHGYVWLFQRK